LDLSPWGDDFSKIISRQLDRSAGSSSQASDDVLARRRDKIIFSAIEPFGAG
jgi:hypothetical protein